MSDRLKDTVQLPQTDFPARAGLADMEPRWLAQWADQPQKKSDAPRYRLHDGPPYPNGDIHAGHALNKVVKDVVCRSRHMMGHRIDFQPGWDCHGLPIETQVIKKKSVDASDSVAFRNQCQAFAQDYVARQRTGFQRLGIEANWDQPYLTTHPDYEAHVVSVFGQLVDAGLVYHGRKPIHWCTCCKTALAEAEIEYDTHQSVSVTVRFPLSELPGVSTDLPVSLWVWTTTPWTLPANVGLAVHPNLEYGVFDLGTEVAVVANTRWAALSETLGVSGQCLATLYGRDLEGCVASHPFLDQPAPIGGADFVTDSDGTGIVHIAPGHGVDDYQVGQRYGWDVVMPVDDSGCLTQGNWAGQFVFKASPQIRDHLNATHRLVHSGTIQHAYPHCWRCHNPVIFRATPQWFIAMDTPMPNGKTLRAMALESLARIQWVPGWGQTRIQAMLEQRPDWCISRQRRWGIPIPVVRCQSCGEPALTPAVNAAIQTAVRTHGSTVWFEQSAAEILPATTTCAACGSQAFEKVMDILDVWFESGSSFMLDPEPADLVIEGTDQHRGWFQSALLLALAVRKEPPFKAVMTHGFIVDEQGKKMSKSKGNATKPEQIVQSYGADILRWWVASVDVKDDVQLSPQLLDQAKQAFLKIRNTIRFLLGNLNGFSGDRVSVDALAPLDRWIVHRAQTVHDAVVLDYEGLAIHRAVQRLVQFCSGDLSAHYLDSVKDRLYCDAPQSESRQCAQSTLAYLFELLIRMIAPILVFTAEDAYQYYAFKTNSSVHDLTFLDPGAHSTALAQQEADTTWAAVFSIKEQVYQAAEVLRQNKVIKQFLQTQVAITLPESLAHLQTFTEWRSVLLVAEVTCSVDESIPEPEVSVTPVAHKKCDRCWRYDATVSDQVCARCAHAMEVVQ